MKKKKKEKKKKKKSLTFFSRGEFLVEYSIKISHHFSVFKIYGRQFQK